MKHIHNEKFDANIVMRDLYYTSLITNIHMLNHQNNMQKMSIRITTIYLIADITTDVIIEETINFINTIRNNNNNYYRNNSYRNNNSNNNYRGNYRNSYRENSHNRRQMRCFNWLRPNCSVSKCPIEEKIHLAAWELANKLRTTSLFAGAYSTTSRKFGNITRPDQWGSNSGRSGCWERISTH